MTTSSASHIEAVKRYKHKHRAEGKCIDCNNWTTGGRCQCPHCAAMGAKRHLKIGKRFRDSLKDAGRCPRCSAPLDPDADYGCITCINCRER